MKTIPHLTHPSGPIPPSDSWWFRQERGYRRERADLEDRGALTPAPAPAIGARTALHLAAIGFGAHLPTDSLRTAWAIADDDERPLIEATGKSRQF